MISNAFFREDGQYLFRAMDEALRTFLRENDVQLINMGIGDVVQPVAPCVSAAIQKASKEIAIMATFRGYAPAEGYDFARIAISEYYRNMGVDICKTQFFIGSGAKDELFAWGNIIDRNVPALVPTPAYPAYVDQARMVGREVRYVVGDGIIAPMPDDVPPMRYLIYLCSPNNPCGWIYTQKQLQEWVDFAINTHSIILFDAAYAAFAYPHSIMTCRGAEEVCIEIGTLSKSASFSGMRFGWSAFCADLLNGVALKSYIKYKSVASNGVSYVVQRAGEAALSIEGRAYGRQLIDGYRNSAMTIGSALRERGIKCNSMPYLWVKLPRDIASPTRYFLERAHMVVTDGEGFGMAGKGYIRLSVFSAMGREQEIISRLSEALLS